MSQYHAVASILGCGYAKNELLLHQQREAAGSDLRSRSLLERRFLVAFDGPGNAAPERLV
jgi:hypothetical protein